MVRQDAVDALRRAGGARDAALRAELHRVFYDRGLLVR